jgi:hypothetical protein
MFAIPQNWGFLASRRHLGQAYGAGSAASAWAALRRGRHRPWAQSGARARFASRGSRRWRTFPCPGHIFSRVKILGTSGIQIKHDKTWIGLSLHRHPGIRAWDDVCFFLFWDDLGRCFLMIKLPWASFEDQTRRLAGHVSPPTGCFWWSQWIPIL